MRLTDATSAETVGRASPPDAWVMVAPHFDHPGHLGGVRCERFCRWLQTMNRHVTVVRAGSHDRIEERAWGICITVRDPLGFYRDPAPGAAVPLLPRRPNRARTWVAHLLMVPDPVVLWARRVLRSSAVRRAVGQAGWVLSSSPPESCHVAAAGLARQIGGKHMVDLRDGWLDEPMIPLLARSAFQRWRHRRIESRIVVRAQVILVTSERWREQLVARYPEIASKVAVLPNACPVKLPPAAPAHHRHRNEEIRLLYAGKIHSSRPERQTQQLMRPLLGCFARYPGRGEIEFIGNLRDDEICDLKAYESRLEASGWRLLIRPPVPRHELLRRVADADGLLILATSMASIPAKLFDYLPSRRPILAVTPEGSEVARLASLIPQLFVENLGTEQTRQSVVDFLDAAKTGVPDAVVPEVFTDATLERRFEQLVTSPGQGYPHRSG